MSEVENIWPDFYPEDTPPDDAIEAKGEAYRLVDNSPPTKADFRSMYEENPVRCKPFSLADFKLACGTSHFTEKEDIKTVRSLFKPFRNKKIAKGKLNQELGVMLDTRDKSHLTVWYRVDSSPHEHFAILGEKE